MMPTARLVPYARNARTHSDQQVAQIAASMAEPSSASSTRLLIGADDVIIAGHGRLMAARRLGMSEAPVIVLGHLTEAQRRALVIADNKIGENAGWDEARLSLELQALLAEDFDLGLLGIPEDELDALLADAEDRPAISDDAADAIPEPPAEPITKPGAYLGAGQTPALLRRRNGSCRRGSADAE
ncbi:ParB/Srx family N-terminal domain-containing protein [Paracoccus sp. (in: a-proteobacteria)]|uniref:ParB/Srx family N-terminal domain-containing protein n=1 Tax=Paracoccus sp. TaxID=267 RepID=UPI003A4C75D9